MLSHDQNQKSVRKIIFSGKTKEKKKRQEGKEVSECLNTSFGTLDEKFPVNFPLLFPFLPENSFWLREGETRDGHFHDKVSDHFLVLLLQAQIPREIPTSWWSQKPTLSQAYTDPWLNLRPPWTISNNNNRYANDNKQHLH